MIPLYLSKRTIQVKSPSPPAQTKTLTYPLPVETDIFRLSPPRILHKIFDFPDG